MLLARLSPKPPMRDDNVYVNYGKRHSQALRELAVTNWN
jgi:hypothetical protein